MNGEPDRPVALPNASPLQAFTGSIERTKTGPLYSAGLIIVAVAMVLLPILYLALVALAAWRMVLHLRYDTWMLESSSGRAGFYQFALYLSPAIAGAILIFFMVKPFFAAQPPTREPLALDPPSEPLLFAFVRKICGLVGAPTPCRIEVDCQVNASARLRHGLWSKDLAPESLCGAPTPSMGNLPELVGLLAAVGAEMPRAHQIGSRLNALALLAQNRGNHSHPAEVDTLATALAAELRSLVDGIQERLKEFVYPFPHARGRLTVAEYARFEKPAEHPWLHAYQDGRTHVERLFALNYQLISLLLTHAAAAEATLEKP
jgi:hypothetical protein